jgi:hypothetical protein
MHPDLARVMIATSAKYTLCACLTGQRNKAQAADDTMHVNAGSRKP